MGPPATRRRRRRWGGRAGQYPLWKYENGKPKGQDDRLAAFQQKWESVITEWSKRWGRRVSGWWFDGCYYPDAMYRHPEPPNFASFAAAVRSGNPDSLVAFNPGVLNPIITLTPEEDYTAGEINDPGKVVCPGRWVGKAQFHMLSYLGPIVVQETAPLQRGPGRSASRKASRTRRAL